MLRTAAEHDAPSSSRSRRRGYCAAGWALACGLYAGTLWPVATIVSGQLTREKLSLGSLDDADIVYAPLLAILGGLCGVVAGWLVGLMNYTPRVKNASRLGFIGLLCGILGGGLTVPAVAFCRPWIHPLVSSSLLWAFLGASAGYATCRLRRPDEAEAGRDLSSAQAVVGWGVFGGAWAAGVWSASYLAARGAFGVSGPFELAAIDGLLLVALGATYGGIGGALVGLFRPASERRQTSLALGFLGVAFGVLAGLAVVLALIVNHAQPLPSSAVAMAAVGFAAGLCGYQFAPQPAKPEEPPYEEDDADAPAVRVEWLLREPKRPWRVSRPLARVLPLLAVSVGALVGACFTSPVPLVAVALLSFAVAHAIYRQEKRLDALERRFGPGRDTRPPV